VSTDNDQTPTQRPITVAVQVDVPFTTTTKLWGEDGPSGIEAELTVNVDRDHNPVLVLLRPPHPLSAAELDRVDWRRTLLAALYYEGRRKHLATADDGERPDNLVVATRRQRRRNLTDDDLDTVAEAYHEGGADEVARRFGVGVRQATRYIHRAREKGLL
jgi:hypothetical protein